MGQIEVRAIVIAENAVCVNAATEVFCPYGLDQRALAGKPQDRSHSVHLCAVAWLGCGGFVVRVGVEALGQYEVLAWAFLIVVSLVVAFGVLVSYWILMSHYDFRRRGYQVRWLTEDDWVYEERRADGSTECLPFMRKIIGDGYPAPCDVTILGENDWKHQAPQWAQGRRAEILERIADLSGANQGGRVQLSDSV